MTSSRRRFSPAPCIAVLGTGSDVGKSVIVAALCRCFADLGVRVAPFKSQNMSNNSGVTPEGLEMGRAQIVQAEAARIAPHVDMNPILLKPTSDVGAQVVVKGVAVANLTAGQYHREKARFWADVTRSLDRLRSEHDLVVIEGAGSCAEVNLMAHDIVNFKTASYADAPVILAADIHRGGVFAQIVGTLACLPEENRNQVAGFLINRFRGDISLFKDGVLWIENRTDKPCLGVIPHFDHFAVEAEDSVVIERPGAVSAAHLDGPAVGIVRIPHISNFTDFDPLFRIKDLAVHFLEKVQDLSGFKALILPGSKNTRHDLEWLHQTGWAKTLVQYAGAGGHILGICGGYQMLGRAVKDPQGHEGAPGDTPGLGLLSADTVLKAPKTTTRAEVNWEGETGLGYEIHMGETFLDGAEPLFYITRRNETACRTPDGCRNKKGNVLGTYIHGLFDTPAFVRIWLEGIGLGGMPLSGLSGLQSRDRDLDLLAEHFRAHGDMKKITALMPSLAAGKALPS